MRGDDDGRADHQDGLHSGQRQGLGDEAPRRPLDSLPPQAEHVQPNAQVTDRQRDERAGNQFAHVEMPVFQRAGEQGFDGAALFFPNEGFQRHHQRDGDREEAHHQNQEREQPFGNQVGRRTG